jgi:alpha-2-macroglobulin
LFKFVNYLTTLFMNLPAIPFSFSANKNFNLLKIFLLLFFVTILLLSCEKKDAGKDKFASPKSLFVDQISSFTSGVISITSPIRLKLSKALGDSLSGIKIEEKIFSFSPNIEGNTYWEDNRTIIFKPKANLPSGQKFEVTANLKTLFPELPQDKQEFRFTFQTLIQNYEVHIGGLQFYQKTDLQKVRIAGYLQTADYAPDAAIQEMVTATQNGKPLELTWNNNAGNHTYTFSIENVSRTESPQPVLLKVAGTPIGVSRSEELEVEVPSLSDYKVVSSQIIRGKENYISVLFSDPLDERQDLNGLVSFTDISNYPRVVVSLNELKIYPTRSIADNAELVINSAIKNMAGFKLKEDYKIQLQFTQSKPEVRLVDDAGKAIMPNTKGLVLPFEAVGLTAVDIMVVKVFENNMLQYLQVNGLGEDYQLRRVGKPIVRKTIPLNTSGVTNLNKWNRFTLDLGDIISSEPGALYMVQIGFKKKHSLYFCGNTAAIEEIDDEPESWGAEDEGSYWDSYEYYYYEDYDWQERDNPCSDSYYGNRRSVSKMLFASDIGIIAKKRDGGNLHVFVTNLLTTKPMAGVSLEVFDYQQQSLSSTTTDADGKAIISTDGTPFVLVASKGEQTGYLKLDESTAISLSNYDVSGKELKNGLKGFIYGERGVWRPADTVHLAFILQDMTRELPKHHPVVMELYNPLGQLTARKVSSNAIGNIYRFDFLTATDAPSGNWQAKAKVGGATFYKRVNIETIKPNRLKVNLVFDKDKFSASDRFISGELNVRWLSGARAGGLRAEYELLLSPVRTTFNGYPNFSFDDKAKDFYNERTTVYSGRVNAEGYAKVNIDLGNTNNAPGALNAKLYGKVYEEGGDFSISNVTIPYYPYKSFVGIKAPTGDKRGILLTDEDHQVRIATVDSDGNPVSRQGVKVALYKLDWRWWWDTSYDDISNYVGNTYYEPIQQTYINTTNGQGEWVLRLNYPDWGRYYIKVEDPVSGHSAGQVVYLDWPGWAGKGKRGELDGATMLDFAVEKSEYKVGEQIALSIPTTSGNRILVSLESGSKVLQTFWLDTKDGNTNVTFEATSDMAPNMYTHLTMIQPYGQEKNDLPLRLYGVQSIKVVDPSTVLEPVIKMPKELRPEQKFSIEVSEGQGKAMAYTLALVDEGLLDITNYKTPDPWSSFFAREALGIKTWDVYDDIMGAHGGKMEHLLAIGGDSEIQPKEEKEANRFKAVVKYLGPFYLAAGETGKHNLQMPQYIGSVKTMVIAAANGAYGSTEEITPVKQPLMVLATLPRVAGPGETMKLPVNIFVLGNKVNNVTLSLETSGGLIVKGAKSKTVVFTEEGDQVVYFDLKTAATLGAGKVKVTAKSGNLSAAYDIELNIIPRNPPITDVTDKVINAGESWQTNYQPIGMPGQNNASIELSSLPSLNIEQRLGYLIRYPHGCIEQTTSAVFAQLFLNKLLALPQEKQDEIQRNVTAGITRMNSFQVSSGGFSYWPGNNYANNWGSNYAGHFLLEARKAGYAVPEGMLANWLSYQTQKAESWGDLSTDEDNDLIQAYRLYSLALAGNPAMGAMNRMKESNNVRRAAKWRLALAYAVAGYSKQAISLIEGLSVTIDDPDTSTYSSTFGSATRDQAMILETLLAIDQKEKAFELLMDIANKMGNKDRWMSTQTTAYCFIAIAKYAEKFKLDEETKVNVTVGGKTSNVNGYNFINQIYVSEADKAKTITIKNNGTAPVFARVISTGTPIEGSEASITRNILFEITYKDQQGKILDISKVSQGTNFKAEVSISNPGQKGLYSDLALTQIFPSGWEIINTRLDGSDNGTATAKYMDIRDDRVMHYFNLKPNQEVSFTVLLNAAYQGKYYLPSVSVEAMYDNSIFANKKGRWVEITGEGK